MHQKILLRESFRFQKNGSLYFIYKRGIQLAVGSVGSTLCNTYLHMHSIYAIRTQCFQRKPHWGSKYLEVSGLFFSDPTSKKHVTAPGIWALYFISFHPVMSDYLRYLIPKEIYSKKEEILVLYWFEISVTTTFISKWAVTCSQTFLSL